MENVTRAAELKDEIESRLAKNPETGAEWAEICRLEARVLRLHERAQLRSGEARRSLQGVPVSGTSTEGNANE